MVICRELADFVYITEPGWTIDKYIATTSPPMRTSRITMISDDSATMA